MACNNTCKYFNFIVGASVVSDQLVLTTNNANTPIDTNNFCFRFSRNIAIPSNSGTLPVYIAINGTNYPLWNKYGDVMTGNDLLETGLGTDYCPRFVYHGYVGAQASGSATITHIIVHNIPRKSYTIYCA